jgi:hypothetical protein
MRKFIKKVDSYFNYTRLGHNAYLLVVIDEENRRFAPWDEQSYKNASSSFKRIEYAQFFIWHSSVEWDNYYHKYPPIAKMNPFRKPNA